MPTSSKTKMRISITILPLTNETLEKIGERYGVSKSALVEQALKKFLKNQLDKDSKALSKLTFDDLPSEDEWLSIMPSLSDLN